MPNLKSIVNSLLGPTGYQITRRQRDAFFDQKFLLQEEPRIIFDVGANIGQTAERYRRLFPNSTIHCFEPFEDSHSALVKRFADDQLVKTHRIAVSDVSEQKNYFINGRTTNNSLLEPTLESLHFIRDMKVVDCIQVLSTTIDKFCADNELQEIHILKMDIQGGEVMALQGATQMLKSSAVDVIYTEVLFASLYKDQCNFYDICRFLADYEYRLFRLCNLSHSPRGNLCYGDAIFTSPRLASKTLAA